MGPQVINIALVVIIDALVMSTNFQPGRSSPAGVTRSTRSWRRIW